jgi:3-deoxy-D-arabino-heptulosonate 7-phosphate (DAHP) synthase class II
VLVTWQIGEGAGAHTSLQAQLENVLARKASMLQSITALESALEDARNQISDAVQVCLSLSFLPLLCFCPEPFSRWCVK